MAMKILVAIPAYRCAHQIGRVLGEFSCELLKRVSEVAVFDNQSPDNTVEVALKSARDIEARCPGAVVRVFRNDQNYGLGGTHKAALLYAEKNGFDYMAILHGDNQASTLELGLLIDEVERASDLDAALGARFMGQSRLHGYSLIRTWGNRGLNLLYTLFSGRWTSDLGSGLNLFKTSTLSDHRYLLFSDAFTFNMDLLLDYFRKGAKVKYVPISWREEDQVSNARTLAVGWITLKTLLKWRVGVKPQLSNKKCDYTSTLVEGT